LHFALNPGRVNALTTGGNAAWCAGVASGVLLAPSFGLRQKCLALHKSAVDLGVFCADLGVCEIEPFGPNPVVLKHSAHALGLGRGQLGQHARPNSAGQCVVGLYLEVGLSLRGTRVDDLAIDAFELAMPAHGQTVHVKRGQRDACLKKRGPHLAFKGRLAWYLNLQIAHLLAIEHASGHRHGMGLARLQDVLTRPRPRRAQHAQQQAPAFGFHHKQIFPQQLVQGCIGSKAANLTACARRKAGSTPSEHGGTALGKGHSAFGKVGTLAALLLALAQLRHVGPPCLDVVE